MRIKEILPEFSLGLSPMEAVTTPCFRQICKLYGADVLFSEFISSDALARGIESSCKKMNFDESERPLAVQIFGNNETSLIAAAEIAVESGCDWVDINWGCLVKKVAGKGCGSGILNDIDKMEFLTKRE